MRTHYDTSDGQFVATTRADGRVDITHTDGTGDSILIDTILIGPIRDDEVPGPLRSYLSGA